jgi:hypothetical protein
MRCRSCISGSAELPLRKTSPLKNRALRDSESVEDLAEEGQSLEAEAISGIEDTPGPDVADVRTKEVPEHRLPT